ncbi:MAG: flagellar export protein FliJ [Clostridia bacterium]|nr:flagellar export protein FliJ [Clostridia bacterium]
MKRFKYSLDTVLDYKTQVLDELRSEHAVIARNVMTKQEEIVMMKEKLTGFQEGFDQTKSMGDSIENFRLYDMCIGRMEELINREKEELSFLKKREESKKKEVISAKVDTSKFERLKDKRMQAYQKAEMKEEEGFVEEFIIRDITRGRFQGRI